MPGTKDEVEAVEGLVRIRIALERGPGEPGPDDDWLWAEPLGSGRYRVESCPFFAYGLSREDVVHAPGRPPWIDAVVERGGHRTLRLALDVGEELGSERTERLLAAVVRLGCTHEVLRPKLVAIDVPPAAPLEELARLLERAARDGALVWEWADPRPS
ncbi:MAG: DUF4265 domain-containing protein [Anaeromyxobacteraceae bacterium]